MSKCCQCVDSTGCTKGLLIDNNKSNISNEISAWWLVCYLEQDLKPPCIQAFFSSFFLACRTCVSGFQLVWSVPFEMFHSRNLCIGYFDCNFISTKLWIYLGVWLDRLFFCKSSFDIVFLTTVLIIAHPLRNTYLKHILLIIFGVLLKVWFDNRWLVQFDSPSRCS